MDVNLISPSCELKNKPSFRHALIPLLAMVIFVGIGYGVYKISAEILLIGATTVAGFVAMKLGLSWREMQVGMVQSMAKGMPAMLIVIVVGALIASWMACGTIPMIIYYGLAMVSPAWFLVTACAISCIVSLVTGTSYGTVGTIGVAFMGMAHGLAIPPAQAAGALVAGAYFGDKMSPFSDTTNLAAAAARVNIYDHIRHMLWTTTPALLLGFVVYAIAGWRSHVTGGNGREATEAIQAALAANFVFTPWLLLPPAISLYLAVRQRPVVPGLLLSSAVAVALAVAIQHVPLASALNLLVTGYAPQTGMAAVDRVLAQGGLRAMMHPTLIALCAFGFSGLMQKAGLLQPVLDRLLEFARTTGRLIAATVAACISIGLLTGSSFLSILIPGELLLPAYRRMGLAGKNLSRTTDDSGTVVVPLIPWSIAGVFMASTLGVPVVKYAPWAVFCYTGFIFALIYGFTGIGIAPRIREDEMQPGS